MTEMTTLETLRAAKKLIRRKKNWIKGDFERGGGYCAWGALRKVTEYGLPRLCAQRALAAQLPPGNRWVGSLVEFNDHPGTKHRDVIRLFNRAIRAEKEKGLL